VSHNRILVPVSDTQTIRRTVEDAVSTALEDSESAYVRFVYLHSGDLVGEVGPERSEREEDFETAETLLDRAAVWAEEDAGDRVEDLTVESAHLGLDSYLFSPEDVGRALVDEATAHDIAHVVLDPEYDPGVGAPLLRPLEYELDRYDAISYSEAPGTRPTRRRPLVLRSTPLQVGVLFGAAFIFYQVLSGHLKALDLVTGAISATIVAVGLSRITFVKDPEPESLIRLGRLTLYIPYLIWEIIKANVAVAAVILNPRADIDPRMTRIRPAVWGSLPITTLANSITLTPGTLTVRVDGRDLLVHSLLPESRKDLFDGGLERAVRFAFYGRTAMAIPSPRERGDTEVLQQPDDETAETDAAEAEDTDDESGNEEPADAADAEGGEQS